MSAIQILDAAIKALDKTDTLKGSPEWDIEYAIMEQMHQAIDDLLQAGAVP